MNLRDAELDVFERLLALVAKRLVVPDIVFYLRMPIEDCSARIQSRKIASEATISSEYLVRLETGYLELLGSFAPRTEIFDIDPSEDANDVATLVSDRLTALG
jgi:thymidylate kinase